MKVIVTGATGHVGREIVMQCLADQRITKVVVLTRRAVGGDIESHPKAEVVMHQDFSQYPEGLLRRLEGAEACLWSIGIRLEQFKEDKELCRKVGVDYALAAASTLCNHIADKTPGGKKFRFVFCSGKYAEWSKKKSLLIMSDTRRHKADVEKGLCEIADANKTKFQVWLVRPGTVILPEPSTAASKMKKSAGGSSSNSSSSSIEPPRLSKAMIKVACEGWKDRVIENDTLVKM